jgi:CheY-like chemotaxis protein
MDTCMLPRIKCLLVDDLQENLLALAALLQRDDVDILTARSGSEALELLLVHEFALALLDVQMPSMDGFELAELMRGSERTRHVPLIFVTAGPREQRRLFKGYDSGAVDFIYKPIDPHILKNKADVFFAVKLEAADFRVLVERVIREHQAAAPERVIEAEYSGDFSGQWDAERIAQVASNLIGNALKHGDAGASVQVRLDGANDETVLLSVANEGSIPPELMDHLFDPFRGAQRPAGRSEGLGLGLYIVFQIVKAHRGTVEAKTHANRTVFRVAVPRAP